MASLNHRTPRTSTATNNRNIVGAQHQKRDNNSKSLSKYLDYDISNNKCNKESFVDSHVLREKMPNNNIVVQNSFNDHTLDGYIEDGVDEKWLPTSDLNDDAEAAADFIDVKERYDAYDDDKVIMPQNCDIYDLKFQKLFNAKCKMRLRSGAERADIDSVNHNHLEYENCKTLPGIVKLQPSSRNIKEEKDSIFVQKKLISPPAPRVPLYNNHRSPRPNLRHLSRPIPSTLRMREFCRYHNKSPFDHGDVDVTSKSIHSNSNNTLHSPDNVSPEKCSDIKKTGNKNDNPKYKQQIIEKGENGLKSFEVVDTINNDDNKNANNKDRHSDSSDDYDDDDDLENVSNFGDSCASDTSSDSENGYRSHAFKMSYLLDKQSLSNTENSSAALLSEQSHESLSNPESLLVSSLFPNVPPFLSFSSNTTKGPDVPPELYRILKWRVTNVMPKVVRCVLANSGVRLLKKTNDWMGIWGKHLKSPCFKTIRPYQKINHLPGSFKIGRKDSCWKNLQRQMLKYGRKDFGFMPKTYIIPHDLNILRKSWPKYAQRNVKWIIKPPASARGAGIRVVDRWAQIPKRKPLIVQKYIERPLLINGSKFDLRLYVLVTSINPLRVFLYHNGLARFASVKYSDKSDTLNDRCMHLTNYSINKFSSNYSKNEDVNACHGHKWTIKSLWSYLANRGIRTDLLWQSLQNLVLRTILAGENSINNMLKINVESKYSCFELFGFDVLLDADLIPWLLEVNISPSLHSELPLDAHVKAPLVQGVLNTALYNVPPKLSLEKQREIAVKMSLPAGAICFDKRLYINYLSRVEKVKHNTYTRKSMEDRDEYLSSILDNLTPDDIRCLIVAEDELARCAPLERIFPTSQTYKYLKFTDSPRYYNRLLDAWENRYANNRNEGIALLREYCESKYHLDVPPPPAKKDSNVNESANINIGANNCSDIYKTEESEMTSNRDSTARSLPMPNTIVA